MRLAVIGAGGHSKEVVDLIRACGHEISGFVDDAVRGPHPTSGYPVVADVSELEFEGIVLAIGDNAARARWYGRVEPHMASAIVHPTAVVSESASVGAGTQVMQHVIVNAAATVGVDCILNVACSIAHDCEVGAHSHIAPGARLGGGSVVGEGSLVGTNATILPGVRVGRSCVIGAGAVVCGDLPDLCRAVGVPARPLPGQVDGRASE